MKGLLIKDWKLLKNQARFILILLAISIVISFLGNTNHISFMTNYLTFIFSIFVLSTLSYDSYDNGMLFLLSLPVSRKTYIQEKYIFSLLLTFSSWLFSLLLRLLIFSLPISWNEISIVCLQSLIYLILVLSFLAYSIPLHLKFGSEKGRMLSFGLLGLLALGIFTMVRINHWQFLLYIFDHISLKLLTIISVFFCIIFLGISYLLSLWIMEKKEF